MTAPAIRVAVVGLGTVGKRVAYGVGRRPGLLLSGIAVRSAGAAVRAMPQLPLYAAPGCSDRLRRAGLRVRGELAELLARTDIVVDCGPAGTGALRWQLYQDAGVRSIFCGGERSPALGPLIHPAVNYERAAGLRSCRLTSCTTTALGRLVAALPPLLTIDAVVIRCATDTDKASKGITNGAVLAAGRTHHGADLHDLVPSLRATSTAATVAMTSGHCVHVRLTLAAPTASDALLAASSRSRLILRAPGSPIDTSRLKEAMHSRRWHNRYEALAQFVEAREGRHHDLWLSIDNEAVTIPEMLDLVHAMGGSAEPDLVARDTDRALGIPHLAVLGVGDGRPAADPVPGLA